MTHILIKSATICVALSFGMTQTAHAQSGQSTETIKQLFEKQLDVQGGQKTRGLMIAPTTQPDTTKATTSVAAAPAANLEIADIPKDTQVNVNISFDFDSAALRTSEKPKLQNLCDAINQLDIPLFRIIGHTDAAGSDDYNERLSLLRAQEVKRFMVNDCGISAARLEALGVGEKYLYNEDNPRGDENRRVEFQAAS